ncbi:hypothetical protein M409DRAFT_54067 [Zasmidium cellare ATCC 36951]|uniref:Uncharacterized protein n=1 Tax=Zasmidium cellare ATCC 36951 TaxID=1080233 RepID=A0A6A6CMM2_ZASCE|nr:uncharacterized protein M409DRAFT_54067 [Zasmidium cellare ATCC 36951]KAF2167468.1 hypothetical protein M409DRAFT_54067 [Zasmidium cellare ATCC 36951]
MVLEVQTSQVLEAASPHESQPTRSASDGPVAPETPPREAAASSAPRALSAPTTPPPPTFSSHQPLLLPTSPPPGQVHFVTHIAVTILQHHARRSTAMERQDLAYVGFGDLPRELRDQIYAEIVAVDETAVCNVHTQVVTSHSGVMIANRCINTEYNEAVQKAQSTIAVLHHPHIYDHRPRSAHDLYLLSRWALREAAWVPGDVTRVLMMVHINGTKFASSSDNNPIASIESPDIRRLITRILKDLLTRFFLEHVVIKIELSNAELNWHSCDRMVDVMEEVNSIIKGTMNTPLRAVGVVLPGHAGFFLERD